ncbi:MAG: diadenylate cyclase CdaA [Acidobacteriia bacterium]|nr:diadenylate cyclase CdaA [Terriglobia bacterium]
MWLPSLPRLNITAIVDILVVAVLIYQLLMIVRGTRAGHILIGILATVMVYAVALWTGLEALRSLLSYIIPYTAIAVIILFQSEIRRTLARIGRKRWLGRGFKRPESIDEILLALSRLSQSKSGALVVLERDIGLRTFVESGVRLDAEISADLVLSIFHPGGALHDGAVIIQKDRIGAAACFLPLTTNPTVQVNLGTRHRAAIGITEESDCLSLVVSEETGDISVAAFGEIHRGVGLRELDERVNAHFGVRRPGVPPPGDSAEPLLESGVKPVEKVSRP